MIRLHDDDECDYEIIWIHVDMLWHNDDIWHCYDVVELFIVMARA